MSVINDVRFWFEMRSRVNRQDFTRHTTAACRILTDDGTDFYTMRSGDV